MGNGGRIAFLGGAAGVVVKGCHGSSVPIGPININQGDTYTSGDLRDGTVVAPNAVGVWLMVQGVSALANGQLFIESADDTPDGYSSSIMDQAATTANGLCMVRLGTGGNAGKIKIKAQFRNWTSIYAYPVGYWT